MKTQSKTPPQMSIDFNNTTSVDGFNGGKIIRTSICNP
jgi:hypothetical protein